MAIVDAQAMAENLRKVQAEKLQISKKIAELLVWLDQTRDLDLNPEMLKSLLEALLKDELNVTVVAYAQPTEDTEVLGCTLAGRDPTYTVWFLRHKNGAYLVYFSEYQSPEMEN